jgi:crotonobetainyl-CoA:carnitine CoA-transferase CaiB-like acyl-CoA transferase
MYFQSSVPTDLIYRYMHGAIMAALYARQRTGEGQKIDGSLFETQVALLTNVGLSWMNMGVEAERWGAQHPSVVPYDAFPTKDLYFVCVSCGRSTLMPGDADKEWLPRRAPQMTSNSQISSRSSVVQS